MTFPYGRVLLHSIEPLLERSNYGTIGGNAKTAKERSRWEMGRSKSRSRRHNAGRLHKCFISLLFARKACSVGTWSKKRPSPSQDGLTTRKKTENVAAGNNARQLVAIQNGQAAYAFFNDDLRGLFEWRVSLNADDTLAYESPW